MTGARKKIIVLGSFAESLINFRRDLIIELVNRGYQVVAVAPDMDEKTENALSQLGVSAKRIAFSRTGMNPISDLRGIIGLRKFFKAEAPHAVISYTAKPVIYGTLAARLAGIKHIGGMITGLGFAFTTGPGIKRKIARLVVSLLYRVALPQASHVVFQNEDDCQLFTQRRFVRPQQMVTVVNGSGVNIERFDVVPLPPAPIFLMIGRFLGAKGVREFSAAAKILRAKVPGARTALVGWIDDSPDSISQLELDKWISQGMENWGRLSDVRPAIAKSSVVVLPSYREGTPRSVLEGMAMGRAIVTTDVPGCRLTVEQGINGFKVKVAAVEPLAEAMIKLAQDASLRARMGDASRQRVVQLYDSKVVAKVTADRLGL